MIEYLFNFNKKVRAKILTFFLSYGFKSFGKKSLIFKPSILRGMKYITIGKGVTVFDFGWLMALKTFEETPQIIIGNNTDIGRLSHIIATKSVVIGDGVLIADKVYISDTSHNFENDVIAIKNQGLKFIGRVEIGDGTWIGEGAIIYGCKIGKNCVIGANSFVNKDVADYSIVVGSPAKVLREIG